ncbi:hypothetical protein ACIBI9_11210 [Nonomuraea sp. NPDC050451]|uniref:hypothetical protein n=1 Tax=Nonomuraea sp. NPDC050451 TaxID=3364364 RepID=UPI0037A63A07
MVIAEMLDIPIHDGELFRTWADRLVALHVEDPQDVEIGRIVGQAMAKWGNTSSPYARAPHPSAGRPGQPDGRGRGGRRPANRRRDRQLLLPAGQITSTMALGNAFLCFRDAPGVESAVRARGADRTGL